MTDRRTPLQFGRSPARQGPKVREVKEWVREAAGAPEDATIMVSELSCSEPGCPPYEVVMAVLRAGQPPVQRKLHKRLAELSRQDVTGSWAHGGAENHQHSSTEPAKED
jgi:hypothetical protein